MVGRGARGMDQHPSGEKIIRSTNPSLIVFTTQATDEQHTVALPNACRAVPQEYSAAVSTLICCCYSVSGAGGGYQRR